MTDRCAIVTGASRGIGRAIALRLAQDGLAVVVNHSGPAVAAEATVTDIVETGGRAMALKGDVSRAADVGRLFDEADAAFGGADVLVSNAGVITVGPLAEAGEDVFDRLFAVNVRGTFLALREAARRLPPGGRIVALSSTTVGLNAPGYGLYNASKGAVEGLARVLAKELGGRGITVNVVAPGPTETDLFRGANTEESAARVIAMTPARRLGQPEEIAEVVAFLCSPAAAWINGQVVRVNGGIA